MLSERRLNFYQRQPTSIAGSTFVGARVNSYSASSRFDFELVINNDDEDRAMWTLYEAHINNDDEAHSF